MCLVIALEMNLLKPILERKGQHVTADEIAYETQSEKSMVGTLRGLFPSLRTDLTNVSANHANAHRSSDM